MPLFKDLLRSDESLFRDTIALDFDYQPKILKYRENEQRRLALAIKPLLSGSNGRNVFICGPPGVGKTTACKHVLKELEEESPDIQPLYINCWKENSTFKVLLRICEMLGFTFLQNKRTGELADLIKKKLNKHSAVFVFDEIDKAEEHDFLYGFLEDIYRKSIILITNYQDTFSRLDERIRSRFGPEFVTFGTYSPEEIKGILLERRGYAFVPGVWEEEMFNNIVEKTAQIGDVRLGLYLMRESGLIAEEKSARVIGRTHVQEALQRADAFQSKKTAELDESLQGLLKFVQDNNGEKIGDLFTKYKELVGEDVSYRTFQRKITKLEEGQFISTKNLVGKDGNTTLVSCNKRLTDF